MGVISIFVLMRFACWLIVCCLLAATKVAAQDPYYITISKSNGLPSNDIYRIMQDSKGFIWIASDEGLTRFDGFEFKTFTSPIQSSKAGSVIKEDKYGRVLYQNFDGYVFYVEHDSLRTIPGQQPVGYIEYGVTNEALILPQKRGFDIYDIKTLRFQKNISFDMMTVGGTFQSGQNYYINSSGLYILNGKGDYKKIGLAKGSVYALNGEIISADRDNREGVGYVLTNGGWKSRFNVKGLNFIQQCSYAGGYYWFCTPKGAAVCDATGKNISNGKTFFSDKNISCVFEDNEHNLWVGTVNQGILFVPSLQTKFITKADTKPNKLLTRGNKVYIATKDNAIYSYSNTTNALELLYKDSVSHAINNIRLDTARDCFIILSKDMKILDNKFRTVYFNLAAIKEVVPVDEKYYAYAATGASGLICANPALKSDWDELAKTALRYSTPEALSFVDARCRAVAYNPVCKYIYSAGSKGLYCFTVDGIKEIQNNGKLIYANMLAVAYKSVFALTMQNNLLRIDCDNTVHLIDFKESGSLAYKIKVIKGELYAVTNFGLQKYHAASQRFTTSYNFRGISNEEINDIDAVGDNFYVATDKGLLLTGKENKESVAPHFRINNIVVNGKQYADTALHSFAHNENDIDIRYSIFSYKTGGKYPLYYSINGGKWQLTDVDAHSLKLASLSAGDYRIDFRLGETEEQLPPQSLSFSIKKALWAEWWFIGLCTVIMLTGIFVYYRRRVVAIKKENALVTEKVELEKNLRTSMLTAIRSQMNPHFFYNALNTIQSFIFTDDKRNASTYLVKFSKLTRMILEMSEKELVSLNDEIEALTIYLELEQMRFTNDFNFEIRVSDYLDMDAPKIPPMIVQPYVENAVKHGLLHKKGNKILTVEFTKLNNSLCITVDDNGIGRKRSEELKQVRNERHTPFSTQANSKRIELLNKDRNNNIAVKFIDKKDDNGEENGTTVILSIPIM